MFSAVTADGICGVAICHPSVKWNNKPIQMLMFPIVFFVVFSLLFFCTFSVAVGKNVSPTVGATLDLVGEPPRFISSLGLVGSPCRPALSYRVAGFPYRFSRCLSALFFCLVGLSARLAFSAHFVDLPCRLTLSAFVGQSLRRGRASQSVLGFFGRKGPRKPRNGLG